MKDKIKQAGFKTQKELCLHLSKDGKPFNRDKLRRMIKRGDTLLSWGLDLKKENMRLREALKTFKAIL